MQSRLMFATATAIRPDILIIDEVLGAGDAYFLAKSKQRVDKIIANGCTLLLVSHSMQQVLELCDEAIWLDGGHINLTGEALTVVKAYEEALYGAMPGSGNPLAARGRAGSKAGPDSRRKIPITNIAQAAAVTPESVSPSSVEGGKPQDVPDSTGPRLQIPTFLPHEKRVKIPALPDQEGRTLHNTTRDGVSRWNGSKGTKIVGFGISGPAGFTDRLTSLQPAQMTIFLESEVEGEVAYTYGVAIYDLQGRPMCRFFSPPDCFEAQVGAGRRVDLVLNPNQLGPGTYVISLSIHHATTIEGANAAPRYDLLARSFEIAVELPDSLAAASAEFFHSCEWNFGTAALPAESKSEEILF
jgi:lipopolysaccharide transport system ATP-binding protein